MVRYRYKAKNNDGKVIRGVFYVDNEEDLRDILANQGYFLVKGHKIKDTSEFFSDFEKVKMDDITNFCRQFGIMLKAGISISDSLNTLKETAKNRKLKNILEEVHFDILNGSKLSDAFSRYPKIFPNFFVNMTSIGEMSGSLDMVMLKLADYYEKDTKVKRKAKMSMAYPTFLLCLVFGVLIILSVFVMPMFDNLFKSFQADLPLISQIVINVSNFFRQYILHILVVILALFLFLRYYCKTKIGRLHIDTLKLRLPFIGNITRSVITSRFASGFSTLLQSGVPLVTSIDVMGRLLGNKKVEEMFETCKSELRRGQKVAKSIQTVDIFPPMLIEMVSVGETSGQLENVLDTTANFFDEQVERDIKKATSAIEPVMIMIIAGIIVTVLLAVFLPMLGLMDAIDNINTTY